MCISQSLIMDNGSLVNEKLHFIFPYSVFPRTRYHIYTSCCDAFTNVFELEMHGTPRDEQGLTVHLSKMFKHYTFCIGKFQPLCKKAIDVKKLTLLIVKVDEYAGMSCEWKVFFLDLNFIGFSLQWTSVIDCIED